MEAATCGPHEWYATILHLGLCLHTLVYSRFFPYIVPNKSVGLRTLSTCTWYDRQTGRQANVGKISQLAKFIWRYVLNEPGIILLLVWRHLWPLTSNLLPIYRVQGHVSTKFGVSTAFWFRIDRRHATGGQTDRRTEHNGLCSSIIPKWTHYKGRNPLGELVGNYSWKL